MTPSTASARVPGAVTVLLLVMASVAVAQSFGRFTWGLVLPGARDDLLGGSNAMAGLFGTANLGAYLAGTIAVGMLASRLSLAAQLRVGTLTATAGLAVASVAGSPAMLAAGLVAMGLGGASIWIPAPALAARAMPPHRRGLAVGLVVSSIGAGSVLVGRMPALLGEGEHDALWQRIYRLECALAVAVTVAVLLLLRDSEDRPAVTNRFGIGALRALEGWLPLTIAYAAFGFSYILLSAYMVARVRDDAGFTVAQASLLFSIQGLASVSGGLVMGRLSDRFGERSVLVVVFAVAAAATVAALSSRFEAVVVAIVLVSATSSGTPALVSAYVVRHTSTSTYGAAFSAVTTSFGLAQMVGPQVGGLIADATGSFTTVFLLSAAVRLGGCAAAACLPRVARSPAPASLAPAAGARGDEPPSYAR